MTQSIEGLVAKLITDSELILNVGSADGVDANMVFKVLDPNTMDVPDPRTGKNLGSIERVKCNLRVVRVEAHLCLARRHPERKLTLGSAALLMSGGAPPERLTGNSWPEGVVVGDPVIYTGAQLAK